MKFKVEDSINSQLAITEVKSVEISIDEQLEIFAELLIDLYLSRYSVDAEKENSNG